MLVQWQNVTCHAGCLGSIPGRRSTHMALGLGPQLPTTISTNHTQRMEYRLSPASHIAILMPMSPCSTAIIYDVIPITNWGTMLNSGLDYLQ